MKNSNTISFYIGVFFGAGSTLLFLILSPAISKPTTEPTPTEESKNGNKLCDLKSHQH